MVTLYYFMGTLFVQLLLSDLLIFIAVIISLNEVFGDIMVLASPPRPPVDPDDMKTRQIFKSSKWNISITNGPIAYNFYTEVKYLKLCQWLD